MNYKKINDYPSYFSDEINDYSDKYISYTKGIDFSTNVDDCSRYIEWRTIGDKLYYKEYSKPEELHNGPCTIVIGRRKVVYKNLTEEEIRVCLDNICWECLSEYTRLSEDLIREFQEQVHWQLISQYQVLSEAFVEEFAEKIDWKFLLASQVTPVANFSDNFLLRFKDIILSDGNEETKEAVMSAHMRYLPFDIIL